jgi:hypothetical protein
VWKHKIPCRLAIIIGVCLLLLFYCTGCSFKSWIPFAGSVVGGGAGAIAGPAGGAVGAGTGYAVGKLYIAEEKEREQMQFQMDIVENLSKGDAAAIAEQVLEQKKKDGFFNDIADEIWNVLRIVGLLIAVWLLVPIFYTRYIQKEVKKNKEEIRNGHG